MFHVALEMSLCRSTALWLH